MKACYELIIAVRHNIFQKSCNMAKCNDCINHKLYISEHWGNIFGEGTEYIILIIFLFHRFLSKTFNILNTLCSWYFCGSTVDYIATWMHAISMTHCDSWEKNSLYLHWLWMCNPIYFNGANACVTRHSTIRAIYSRLDINVGTACWSGSVMECY